MDSAWHVSTCIEFDTFEHKLNSTYFHKNKDWYISTYSAFHWNRTCSKFHMERINNRRVKIDILRTRVFQGIDWVTFMPTLVAIVGCHRNQKKNVHVLGPYAQRRIKLSPGLTFLDGMHKRRNNLVLSNY